MNPEDSVKNLKGIGEKKAELLAKLGIFTIKDLLSYYPRTYQDRGNCKRICDLAPGEEALCAGTVMQMKLTGKNFRKPTLRLLVNDGSGNMEVIFFNGKWLQKSFNIGDICTFFGKAELSYGKITMLHPEYSKGAAEDEGILPIYPLTSGLRQSDLRKWIKSVLEQGAGDTEFFPREIIEKYRLCPRDYALANIHFPKDRQKYKEAAYRLAFEELFLLQTGLLFLKNGARSEKGIAFKKEPVEEEFIEGLPFTPTGAQKRAIEEIARDMEKELAMNRLLQGDVGSGKTVVAQTALFKAVKNGYQGVLMAPTEILAKQHFEDFRKAFEPYGMKIGFLGGTMPAKQKKETLEDLESGEIDIAIGTHALIQDSVSFKNLGLVITDEQHRFGVEQRKKLGSKGEAPDMLVMTATPIPRTLAVILYGDLDISIIDELPPGRQAVKTTALKAKERKKAYDFMAGEIQKGRQCYIVAPLIEDSESIEASSAQSLFEDLKEEYPDIRFALLHGDMKQAQKDEIMEDFFAGSTDVLVSTVVIEVGINVPNATLMIIENSERFGLAQLHQLRGRVGRGKHQSYCMLILGNEGEIAEKRAEIMCASTDGFYISEEDLKLRGPGEIFGTRQHGLPDLKVADLAKHTRLLAVTQGAVKELLEEDRTLSKPENAGIKSRIAGLFGKGLIL